MAAMEAQIRRQIADAKARTSPPAVAEPAARAMARLCQTMAVHPDWFDLDDPFNPPWTPTELKELGVHVQTYQPDSGTAEFGGGFYHYGYKIKRNADQSTPTSVSWKLTFKRRGRGPGGAARLQASGQRCVLRRSIRQSLRRRVQPQAGGGSGQRRFVQHSHGLTPALHGFTSCFSTTGAEN